MDRANKNLGKSEGGLAGESMLAGLGNVWGEQQAAVCNRHGGLIFFRASSAVSLRREGVNVSDLPINRHFAVGMFRNSLKLAKPKHCFKRKGWEHLVLVLLRSRGHPNLIFHRGEINRKNRDIGCAVGCPSRARRKSAVDLRTRGAVVQQARCVLA